MYDFEHLDHYQILGMSPSTSLEEIKKAYRREIARYHPDRFHNATPEERAYAMARSQRITEAYRVLTDPGPHPQYSLGSPPVQVSQEERLEMWYTQGRTLFQEGHPQKAADLLRRVLELDPLYRDSAVLLAQAESAAQSMPVAPAQKLKHILFALGVIAGSIVLLLSLWLFGGRPQTPAIGQPTAVVLARSKTASPATNAEPGSNTSQTRDATPITEQKEPSPDQGALSPPTATSQPNPTAEPATSTPPPASPTPQPPSPTPSPGPTLAPTPARTPSLALPDEVAGPVIIRDDFAQPYGRSSDRPPGGYNISTGAIICRWILALVRSGATATTTYHRITLPSPST